MDSLDEYISNLENIVKQKGVNFISENEAKFNKKKELNEYFIKKFKFNKGAFTKRREKIDEIILEKKKELKSIKKEFIYYYEK